MYSSIAKQSVEEVLANPLRSVANLLTVALKAKNMKTINRTVVTIIPKKLYIDWANSFDDDGPKLYADTIHATSLLIPENYDEYNYELFMKRNYKKIFEEELSSWMEDPDVWPKNRDYNKFKKWFGIIPSDTVFELGEGQIVTEDY